MQPAVVQVTEVVTPNDARRVREARAGDVRAFESIVTAALPGAYRLASAILGPDEAADATQNAFVAAWRELPHLRDPDRFDAWFHRILVNECRMQVRRRARAATVPLEDRPADPPAGAWDATELDQVGLLDLLEHAFEGLDADDRAMVVMHHLEGRPLAEIADVLHMPVGTVKWRLHEAREALQRALEVA